MAALIRQTRHSAPVKSTAPNANFGKEMQPDQVTIYTDGSCLGNPGPGGWACLLECGEHKSELFGSHPNTTNNRMELEAVMQALRALTCPRTVQLVTDSVYVKDGLIKWIVG